MLSLFQIVKILLYKDFLVKYLMLHCKHLVFALIWVVYSWLLRMRTGVQIDCVSSDFNQKEAESFSVYLGTCSIGKNKQTKKQKGGDPSFVGK